MRPWENTKADTLCSFCYVFLNDNKIKQKILQNIWDKIESVQEHILGEKGRAKAVQQYTQSEGTYAR